MGFSLASLVLIYAIVHRCAGRVAAIAGAVLFAFASSDPGTAGEGWARRTNGYTYKRYCALFIFMVQCCNYADN